eukprot:TRINITY_DN10578_c0_g1_i2.p1 TRINITY_DN10578_c0_g1~~TRINITY_DN10578_c0_g1_i2.p1  ORF type:complete len:249 (+),score=31.64 TRINITY_DN10578_c0_g1_i2:783-1529(+)
MLIALLFFLNELSLFVDITRECEYIVDTHARMMAVRFAIDPLLTPTLVFMEQMASHEAIHLIGSRPFAAYEGYGGSLEYVPLTADHPLPELLPDGTSATYITAIDALCRPGGKQFRVSGRLRELRKALAGFMHPAGVPQADHFQHWGVTTGNWGCGVFGGFRPLKVLLQWMAASVAHRDMTYCTFDKDKAAFGTELADLASTAVSNNVTVGQLWSWTDEVCERALASRDLKELKRILPVLTQRCNLDV